MPARQRRARGYAQFCPVAKATEVLGRRWVLLIVRELLHGPGSFNSLRKGMPQISPTLLSARLKSLEESGIVVHGDDASYRLTASGEELRPIVVAIGQWGARWLSAELDASDLDVDYLFFDMQRRIDPTVAGSPFSVFLDVFDAHRRFWLVTLDQRVDVHPLHDPRDTDLVIRCELGRLVRLWLGHVDWAESGIEIVGDVETAARFRKSLRLGMYARVQPAHAWSSRPSGNVVVTQSGAP